MSVFKEKFMQLRGMLVYVCVTKPVNCLDKERGTEWKAGVVLTDEDQADEFEKACTAIGAKPSLKKVKTAEFESIYKCAPPDEAERNVWVVTLRKNTKLGSTGKEVPELYRPRVMQREGNMLVDITNDPEKIVGNGSLGVLSVDLFERNDGKANIYLKNVLVEDLKAYKKSESAGADYVPGAEFDIPVQSEAEEPEEKPAEKPAAKEKSAKTTKSPF